MLSNEKEGEWRSVPLWMGGKGLSEATDTTKGCKIHFAFLSLSNGRAEVTEGECGAFVNKRRVGKWGNKIHFLTPLFRIFLRERGWTGGVCRGRGTAVHMEKRKRGQGL